MTSNSNFPLAKKRGRPLGSKNKRTRTVAGKEYTFKKKAFKQSNTAGSKPKAPKAIPLGAFSWVDAYEKTYANLERACERLVAMQGVQAELEQAKVDIVSLSTIINYLEIRLEEQYRKSDERTSV
jgi:murein L,D-transpeptidase YafK